MRHYKLFGAVIALLFISTCSISVHAATTKVTPSTSSNRDVKAVSDRLSIQNAVNHGGTVQLMPGTYYLDRDIEITQNNVTIQATGAKIQQLAKQSAMIKTRNDKKGYSGVQNLKIIGGTWVQNTADKAGKGNGCTSFRIIHASGIVIQNVTLLNSNEGHQIEFAGVKDSKVLNSTFGGTYTGKELTNEAIQFDICHDSANVGNMRYYDDTYCKNILIQGNTIRFHRGIGSHTMISHHYNENITIRNNKIASDYEAITFYTGKNILIEGNTITRYGNTGKAFAVDFKTSKKGASKEKTANKGAIGGNTVSNSNYNIVIRKNILNNCDMGVRILGNTTAKGKIAGIQIQNNTIANAKYRGIMVNGCINNTNISGNNIQNITAKNSYGIQVYNCKKVKVTNNKVANAKCYGIHSYGSKSTSIVGNTITNAKKYCIGSLNSSGISIKKNTFSGKSITPLNVYYKTSKSITMRVPKFSKVKKKKLTYVFYGNQKIKIRYNGKTYKAKKVKKSKVQYSVKIKGLKKGQIITLLESDKKGNNYSLNVKMK